MGLSPESWWGGTLRRSLGSGRRHEPPASVGRLRRKVVQAKRELGEELTWVW